MVMQPGMRVGVYEIVALLGRGGMGEVYRARDAKLGRDVAIKVLTEAWLKDPDRRARLEREARVLASLNHPHIGAIYGAEEAGGMPALVLELIDGQTLAELLSSSERGLPLKQALEIARQIADALDAAHERGVIHRDLKPANIKLTPSGVVKVLDFGLATFQSAVLDGGIPESASMADQAATIIGGGTLPGTILGTARYMSPEQARGRPVDKRTDVWAFGCVLYEMLTGRTPFGGETSSDVIAGILEREPAWAVLPGATPPRVRRLLERCLAKDPKHRVRDIGDARFELDDALGPPDAPLPTTTGAPAKAPPMARWVAVAAGLAVLSGVVAWTLRPRLDPSPSWSVSRLVVAQPPAVPLAVDAAQIAMSPDGRSVAYVAGRGSNTQIYVRDLNQFNSTPIPGTEGGSNPFFSPDSQWLGFSARGRLMKVLRNGGTPVTVSEVSGAVTWQSAPKWEVDDTILFTPTVGAGIWRVAAGGGTPTAVTSLMGSESSHRWPQLLPGGKALLFSAFIGSDEAQVYIQPLGDGPRRPLFKGSGATFLPTGHLAYVQAGTLMAVPFDAARLEVKGPPVAVLSGIMEMNRLRNSALGNQAPQVSFSAA